MLMMLALCGLVSKLRPADAHCWLFGVWCANYAKLMLMMLALWGLVSKLH